MIKTLRTKGNINDNCKENLDIHVITPELKIVHVWSAMGGRRTCADFYKISIPRSSNTVEPHDGGDISSWMLGDARAMTPVTLLRCSRVIQQVQPRWPTLHVPLIRILKNARVMSLCVSENAGWYIKEIFFFMVFFRNISLFLFNFILL